MFRPTFGPITKIKNQLCKLSIFEKLANNHKPKASEVLDCHLRACNHPYWTSYFVAYNSIINDQFGWSHFNWTVDKHNYHVLRVGCYPYIKYHCSKRPVQDLYWQNVLFTAIKILNLGIPTLAYGIAGAILAKHHQLVVTDNGTTVRLYFWYPENRQSPH